MNTLAYLDRSRLLPFPLNHHAHQFMLGLVGQRVVFHVARTHVLMQQVVELVNIRPGLISLDSNDESCIWFHPSLPKSQLTFSVSCVRWC
jgi:hypothetical protein